MQWRELARNTDNVVAGILFLAVNDVTYRRLALNHKNHLQKIRRLRSRGYDRNEVQFIREQSTVLPLIDRIYQSGREGAESRAALMNVLPKSMTRSQQVAFSTQDAYAYGRYLRSLRRDVRLQAREITDYLKSFR